MINEETLLENALSAINNAEEDYNSPDSPFNGWAGEYLVAYCIKHHADRDLTEIVNEYLVYHLMKQMVEKGILDVEFNGDTVDYKLSETFNEDDCGM